MFLCVSFKFGAVLKKTVWRVWRDEWAQLGDDVFAGRGRQACIRANKAVCQAEVLFSCVPGEHKHLFSAWCFGFCKYQGGRSWIPSLSHVWRQLYMACSHCTHVRTTSSALWSSISALAWDYTSTQLVNLRSSRSSHTYRIVGPRTPRVLSVYTSIYNNRFYQI
jgi:hypothetical protein